MSIANPLRIGTWNVEYAYPKRLDALRRVLAENDADIWVLTETHDELAPSAAHNPIHSTPRPKNWAGIREGSRWVTIWSRFPIVEHFNETADAERTVCGLVQLGADKQLLVYGTVLPWKGDRSKFDWSEHHRIVPQQCEEWRSLAAAHPTTPICVAGDFNTDMSTGSYYGTKVGIQMLRAGLAECGLYCATAAPEFPAGLLQHPPIDHIALPSAWKSACSVAAAWPADKHNLSDHSGVVLSIEV